MSTVKNNVQLALALAVLALSLGPAAAVAAPEWELSIDNSPTTLPRSDERMVYKATAKNVGSEEPLVGDQLKCVGPLPEKQWFPGGDDGFTFSIEWRRNGVPIPGAGGPWSQADKAAQFYTTTSADAGKAIQCLIKGTNDAAAGIYASLPARMVAPEPAVAAPTPSSRTANESRPWVTTESGGFESAEQAPFTTKRFCHPPRNWSITAKGTATTAENSKTLTEVATATGSGTLTEGSALITGVSVSSGYFLKGQTISGGGIVAGTTITGVNSSSGNISLSAPATTSGAEALTAGAQPFLVGQEIEGPGIPAGTIIVAVEGRTLTLSNEATADATEVSVSTPGSYAFQWLRNGVPIPGAETDEYQPEVADDKTNLQCEVIGSGTGGSLVGLSDYSRTGSFSNVPWNSPDNSLEVLVAPSGGDQTVTLDIGLPSGQETLIYKVEASGWSCATIQPQGEVQAKVSCTREDPLQPGQSYPGVTVTVQLGADSPEPNGTATATVSGGGATNTASDTATYTFTPGSPFGVLTESFEAGVFDSLGADYTQAGGHPYSAFSTFGFNVRRTVNDEFLPVGRVKDVIVDAPRGFGGNALATPELCGSIEAVIEGECPAGSVIGGIDVYTNPSGNKSEKFYPEGPIGVAFKELPIYSLEPEFGQPAQFAFAISTFKVPYTFVPELRADEGYAISFRTAPIVTAPPLLGSDVTLCGFGAKTVAGGEGGKLKFDGCREAGEAGAYPFPLITNPTRCSGPPPTAGLRINSWENPDEVKTYDFTAPAITGCEQVKFEPSSTLAPTNRQADSPTGLEVEVTMPTDGLLDANGIGQANLNNATVTFPKGMTINPAAADGLGACTPQHVKLKSNVPAECPESSKVGQIEIETPIIREPLKGSVYVASQNDNPFNETLGLYMVFSSARDGVTVKIAGKVVPDPLTGQLVSTFTENPEAPFSRLALKFTSGPRAPLINPPKCGTYAIRSEFSPWSALNPANPTPEEIVVQDSTYKVTRGPNNTQCPTGALEPKLKAGLTDPTAGAKSPFLLSLSREDGTQRFSGLEVANPEGLTAYLKGVSTCSESSLANVSGAEGAGASEIASPSCPANSLVGTAEAGSGAGPLPFYVKTGKVYLAGPYKGAPISLVVITPALAGPFDFGNVLVRVPLYVDPSTAQVTAVSDPIPLSLHGIALNVRDIRVALDRPGFTAAPTSCEPSSVDAKVSGADGATANVSNLFQVGGCEALGFKPRLSFRLFGGTKRGAHPRFRAILKPRPGDANIAKASVALPRSAFLDQGHIRTVCTRVQFAADNCPQGSIYGKATATTPLLDHSVSGPVYLRSSSNELPDMVVALKGPDSQPIEVELAGRIDSVNGGIRSTFDIVPDQPVSSFTLTMQGGKKGLLINSTDLCKGKRKRATAVFTAQNGRELTLRPEMKSSCGKRGAKSKGKKRPR